MIFVRPKIAQLTFQLFDRTVHPELFEDCAYKFFQRDAYRVDVHVTTAGHVIKWTDGSSILTEVAAAAHQPLPQGRRLLCHTISGQRTDTVTYRDYVTYRNELEIEAVDPKTFAAVQHELSKMQLCEGVLHRFDSNGRLSFGAVSYVNVESRQQRVRIRTFHTFPDDNAILKSVTDISLS